MFKHEWRRPAEAAPSIGRRRPRAVRAAIAAFAATATTVTALTMTVAYAAGEAAFEEPTGTIALRDALALALVHGPSLAPWSTETRVAEAEALQAGLRPNPEIGIAFENFAGTGEIARAGASEATITLSHVIERGGKRAKRAALAGHDRDIAARDFEIARAGALTETANAFVALLAAQENLALADELANVAAEMLTSVERRVEAGATSPVEESRARVELEMSRVEQTSAKHALHAARVMLAQHWGSTTPMFDRAIGDLEQVPPVPSRESLLAAVDENPSIARRAEEIDRRRAALDLTRAEGSSDVSVGAGVRYLNDTDDAAFLVEFGFPLRVFDRNQGAERAAELRVNLARDEQRAAFVRIVAQITHTHEMLLAAEDEVTALRDRALPEAARAFEAAQTSYLRGSIRFTDVLDTERLLFELNGRYFDALVRYHHTLNELERLTGTPVTTASDESDGPGDAGATDE